MDENEDPNLSDTQGQSNFILLPSQEETQDTMAEPEEQMKKILTSLPALKVSIGGWQAFT